MRALDKLRSLLTLDSRSIQASDEIKILVGTLLSHAAAAKQNYASLAELEFKVFSQFGDDGIIQYLTAKLALPHRTFVEFGVEDYTESCTRFLLQKDNWSGFVMDGSDECIERLRHAPFFWKHDLEAAVAFVTRENVSALLHEHASHWPGIGLLHIDVDGNDYWVWRAIDLQPAIVMVEYNSVFGVDRAITIPYAANFRRAAAHYSDLYWGASLKALHRLAGDKGYAFIGCNSAGNNAYFVRRDVLNASVPEVPLEPGYVHSKFRESRDRSGELSYLSGSARAEAIRGLPVHDLEQDKVVPF